METKLSFIVFAVDKLYLAIFVIFYFCNRVFIILQEEGGSSKGVDIETGDILDSIEASILDAYLVKHWALRLATNAAVTVLRVDQIIMAKAAGGPKPPKQGGDWDKDADE